MSLATQTYDGCVVGAGFAGIAAAVQSARLGLRTLLIEKSAAFGGVAYTAMHQQLCGLYPNTGASSKETLNGGLSREVAEGLLARKGSSVLNIGKLTVLQYDPRQLNHLLSDLVKMETDLEILFESRVEAVRVENQSIKQIDIRTKEGKRSIHVRALIDGSAGEAVRLSGASYELARTEERQLAAYAVEIEDTTGDPHMMNLKVAYHLARAAESGEIGRDLRYSMWLSGRNDHQGILRISVLPSDGTYDIEAIRKNAIRVHEVLKKKISEFRVSRISGMAPGVSEREGIRMTGRYRLTEKDVLEGRKFEDGRVKSAWPIEFWDQRKGPQYHYIPDGDYYEIPTRALRSRDINNLFAAGRCISTDSKALASVRVTGTCLALGEQSARAMCSYLAATPGDNSEHPRFSANEHR